MSFSHTQPKKKKRVHFWIPFLLRFPFLPPLTTSLSKETARGICEKIYELELGQKKGTIPHSSSPDPSVTPKSPVQSMLLSNSSSAIHHQQFIKSDCLSDSSSAIRHQRFVISDSSSAIRHQ
jgi:hypothetical protein